MSDKIDKKLEQLYERLDNLADLRDSGYLVPLSDLSYVQDQIKLLESLK